MNVIWFGSCLCGFPTMGSIKNLGYVLVLFMSEREKENQKDDRGKQGEWNFSLVWNYGPLVKYIELKC